MSEIKQIRFDSAPAATEQCSPICGILGEKIKKKKNVNKSKFFNNIKFGGVVINVLKRMYKTFVFIDITKYNNKFEDELMKMAKISTNLPILRLTGKYILKVPIDRVDNKLLSEINSGRKEFDNFKLNLNAIEIGGKKIGFVVEKLDIRGSSAKEPLLEEFKLE